MGGSYWDNADKGFDAIIEEYDEFLDDFVYKKIWSSLTAKEREIIRAIPEDEVKTGAICGKIGMNNGSFSKYRDKLIVKGILESPKHGYVSLALPRFYEVTEFYRL